MQTILVPIDGSESSLRALKAAAGSPDARPASLHVLNAQPPILSGNVKRFISADMINDYYQEEGQKALAAARAWLDEAGISYRSEIKVGPVAPTIAQYAKDHQCTRIVMGTRGLGTVTGLVLGSVASKVLSLADVPVMLVK